MRTPFFLTRLNKKIDHHAMQPSAIQRYATCGPPRQVFGRATSLGGTESLVEHRRSIEPPDSATPDDLLRLAVGLENHVDLARDLDQALARVSAAAARGAPLE